MKAVVEVIARQEDVSDGGSWCHLCFYNDIERLPCVEKNINCIGEYREDGNDVYFIEVED